MLPQNVNNRQSSAVQGSYRQTEVQKEQDIAMDGRVWTGLIWLRKGTSGGLL
jgi:hypothetical protein